MEPLTPGPGESDVDVDVSPYDPEETLSWGPLPNEPDRERLIHEAALHRLRIRLQCEENKDLRKEVRRTCEVRPDVFINDWLWTFDQRNPSIGLPADVPFLLRPRQEEFLWFMEDRYRRQESGLVEKSRDEGVTYMAGAWGLWHWLFDEGFKMGIGSRKSTLVDQLDNMDAIIPKIRYMLYKLPSWFLPNGFDRRFNDNVYRLFNPEKNCLFTGEGGTDIGRGGRSSAYLVDEHASIPKADEIEASLAYNCPTIFYVSTPKGVGNLFYRKRFSGRIQVFTFSWRDNPSKNFTDTRVVVRVNEETHEKEEVKEEYYPWYERECSRWDPVIIAQEIDLDYTASIEGIIIPGKYVQSAVDLELPEVGPVIASLDVGEGKAENSFGIRRGPVVTFTHSWLDANTVITGRRSARWCQRHKVNHFRFDRMPSGVAGVLDAWDPKKNGKINFTWEGYNGGLPPSVICYSDDPNLPAVVRFVNRKIEDLWSLRIRFFKTWQHVNGVASYPLDELISIPNDPTLIAQLSVTRYFQMETGKIRAEKKKELQSRGVASPDRAEMLYMMFSSWPVPRKPKTAIRSFD